MAWRFQPSKFKNTAPKLPKKDETIYDLPIGNLSSTNNAIQANKSFLAFLIDGEGGKLGVLPISARGRRLRNEINIICAHGDPITDFCFLPFDKNLLATCGGTDSLKIWSCDRFAQSGESVISIGDPFCAVELGGSNKQNLDCLSPHNTASGLIAVGSGSSVTIIDIGVQKGIIDLNDVPERVLATDWSPDGKFLIASGNKGREGCLFDPRASAKPIQRFNLHAGMGRESRIIFADDKIVSSGFTNNRLQEVLLFDSRDWHRHMQTEIFDPSTGLLVPLYDPDSRLLFLAGKGACKFTITEVKSDGKPPLSRLSEQNLNEPILGACLVNKKSCDVMSGEVQRFHQLTKNSIVPIPCIVPRRSYSNFHEDLFPLTVGSDAGCPASLWYTEGSNDLPKRVSLNPQRSTNGHVLGHSENGTVSNGTAKVGEERKNSGNGKADLQNGDAVAQMVEQDNDKKTVHYQSILVKKESSTDIVNRILNRQSHSQEIPELTIPADVPLPNRRNSEDVPSQKRKNSEDQHPKTSEDKAVAVKNSSQDTLPPFIKMRHNKVHPELPSARASAFQTPSNNNALNLSLQSSKKLVTERPKSCLVVAGTKQSKFRHVEVHLGTGKDTFTNLRNVNNRLPIESNAFSVSEKFAAVPLAGTAGIVAILELTTPVKMPDGIVDGFNNGSLVTDLQWNPFHAEELAIGLDNGTVNIWRVEDPNLRLIGSAKYASSLLETEEDKPKDDNWTRLSSLVPYFTLNAGGSGEKVTQIRYNPTVDGLLGVGLSKGKIQLWNISSAVPETLAQFDAHFSQGILSFCWSSNGQQIASVGRDSLLKVFRPFPATNRTPQSWPAEQQCICETKALESTRGARVLFVADDSMLLVVGFSKTSARQCSLFRIAQDADNGPLDLVHTEVVDTSTQPLVPCYDLDTSVLVLTGKGDRTVNAFELCAEAPYFLRLSPFTAPSAHQAIALQHKNTCDVMAVEFQKGWRLTERTLERVSFRVPRIKKDLFQRDIFPPAIRTWLPLLTVEEWLEDYETFIKLPAVCVDLCPPGVEENISPRNSKTSVPINSSTISTKPSNTDEPKSGKPAPQGSELIRRQTETSWSQKIAVAKDDALEQDAKEGVDESEWTDGDEAE